MLYHHFFKLSDDSLTPPFQGITLMLYTTFSSTKVMKIHHFTKFNWNFSRMFVCPAINENMNLNTEKSAWIYIYVKQIS